MEERVRDIRLIEEWFPIGRLSAVIRREKRAMKPVYQMHSWPARRAGSEFRAIILATFLPSSTSPKEFWALFYRKVDLACILGYRPVILDPFMGGGTTIIEALRLGCKAIGIELNPVAWFITKKEVEPCPIEEFEKAVRELVSRAGKRILSYYKTTCPICGRQAKLVRAYWVRQINCEKCGNPVPLFQYVGLSKIRDRGWIYCYNCDGVYAVKPEEGLKIRRCPGCGAELEPLSNGRKYKCPCCGHIGTVIRAVKAVRTPPRAHMYAIYYTCEHCGSSGHKVPDEGDRRLFALCEELVKRDDIAESLRGLNVEIRYGEDSRRILAYGIKTFYELFNSRQLLVLAKIREAILNLHVSDNVRELLLLAFSDIIEFNNIMVPWTYVANKVESCFSIHNYLFSHMYAELNAWDGGRGSFMNALEKVRRGKLYCRRPFERLYRRRANKLVLVGKTYTGDSCEAEITYDIDGLGEADALLLCASSLAVDIRYEVDAIITDPPYFDNVIYSGLSDMNYVWLRDALSNRYPWFLPSHTPRDGEIVVDPSRPVEKSGDRYAKDLAAVFSRFSRALKDDGLLVLTFHHRKTAAWAAILEALIDSGFTIRAVWPVRSEARSYPHTRAPGAAIYDAIVVARMRSASPHPVSVEDLSSQAVSRALEMLKKVDTEDLTWPTTFTIVMGQVLGLYSRHHPDVYDGPRRVTVEDMIALAEGLAKEVAHELGEEPSASLF